MTEGFRAIRLLEKKSNFGPRLDLETLPCIIFEIFVKRNNPTLLQTPNATSVNYTFEFREDAASNLSRFNSQRSTGLPNGEWGLIYIYLTETQIELERHLLNKLKVRSLGVSSVVDLTLAPIRKQRWDRKNLQSDFERMIVFSEIQFPSLGWFRKASASVNVRKDPRTVEVMKRWSYDFRTRFVLVRDLRLRRADALTLSFEKDLNVRLSDAFPIECRLYAPL
ncbi:hypothetical protein SISSUDRAFT_1038542 [Sistotremastrum suecicum HHB10207 ss-3]|uniref:Uncharacterized protein n=1 Tax=Sistotremastrum suecicum HHB10207 ss-3 TaxID=1314776 RepID=A0A165WL70_9AGAM|nr:hypothetical protein SISSUDRAFT_1038542 [Sistotremastrum suecicum HHB10207 ss-3]